MKKDLAIRVQRVPGQGVLPYKSRRILSAYGKEAVRAGFSVRIHRFATSDGVVIVTIVCDDSWSAAEYHSALSRGINQALGRLKANLPDGAIITLKAMKSQVPWVCCVPLAALELPLKLGYEENGNTPLWQATLEALALAIALCKELAAKHIKATSTTIVATDDHGDTMSVGLSPNKVARVIRDMRRRGHVIQGMGAGNPVGYRAILRAMGILDEDIFDASNGMQIDGTFSQFAELVQAKRLALTAG